jgi:hypothetical protein
MKKLFRSQLHLSDAEWPASRSENPDHRRLELAVAEPAQVPVPAPPVRAQDHCAMSRDPWPGLSQVLLEGLSSVRSSA